MIDNENKFTVGPWKTHFVNASDNKQFHVFGGEGGHAICSRSYQYDDNDKPFENFEEIDANAKLIGAAPQLFKALNEWVEWRKAQEISLPYPEEEIIFNNAVEAINIAIA